MARPKPPGFDNYRTHSFVTSDGSGTTFWQKGSFSIAIDATHRVYGGPNILSISANVNCIITTEEPHGFFNGQTVAHHDLPDALQSLSPSLEGLHVIFDVTESSYAVGVDTTNLESAVTAGSFVVGDTYTIVTLGTTNFTTIGASATPAVGEVFTATGIGSGTGTALKGLSVRNVGIAGIDLGTRLPAAKYDLVVGPNCMDEHPAAWEMQMVG